MSPVVQAMVGEQTEFESALRSLRGPSADIREEQIGIQVLILPICSFDIIVELTCITSYSISFHRIQ